MVTVYFTNDNRLIVFKLGADLLDLVFQNVSRMNETSDSDRTGVYHVLGKILKTMVAVNLLSKIAILEALSSRTSVAEVIGKHSSILQWLLSRSTRDELPVTQNKQYAAEVLAVLLQSSNDNIHRFVDLNGVDVFLQALSAFRRRDPTKGSEEEEFMENLFDCVAYAVDVTYGKEKFVEAEGVELCLIMLKEGKMGRPRALRILDHALGGPFGTMCAERLVEAAGLKQVFSLFMRKQDSSSREHVLGILASLLRLLPGDSSHRIRLLGKFVEKEYEKINRLMQLRRDYASSVAAVEEEVDEERQQASVADRNDLEGGWFSRKLDAGLYSLQVMSHATKSMSCSNFPRPSI